MNALILTYAINALWQVPLLAAAAWVTARLLRPSLRVQHILWVSALILAALLPLRGEHAATPLQAPAIAASATANPAIYNPAAVEATETPTAVAPPTLPLHIITLSPAWQSWLTGLFLLASGWFALRLLAAFLSLRRITSNSKPLTLSPQRQALLEHAAASIGIAPPSLALAQTTAGPLVAGFRNPRIVLPTTLLEAGDQEFTAALLHELAHIRRRDLPANFALRLIALPIAWHPATALLDHRIRQTREMLCDEAAAQVSPSPTAYARNLLSLSNRLLPTHQLADTTLAPGLFNPAPSHLEERIMKLIAPSARPSFRLARLASAATILAGALTVATVFHLSPAVLAAQQPPTAPVQPVPASEPPAPPAPALEAPALPPAAPLPSVEPLPPAAPLAPVNPIEPQAPTAPVPPAHHHRAVRNHSDATSNPNDRIGQKDLKFNFNFNFDPKIAEINSPDMKALQAQINQQAASINATVNSPEFKRQMASINSTFNSPEFKQKMASINAHFNSPEFKRKMASLNSELNSPEFKAKIAAASRRQVESAKQLAEASAKIAEARTHVQDEVVQKQLDEAQKAIDKARADRAH